MFKRKNPAALASQLASLSGSKGFNSEDKGEWKLKLDNAGNGQAVIRFLPGKGDEGVPFAVLVNHGFKKGGKWYIENCTSTHGDYDSCPVCQYLSKNDSYNTNNEEYKLLKRKLLTTRTSWLLKTRLLQKTKVKSSNIVSVRKFGTKSMQWLPLTLKWAKLQST